MTERSPLAINYEHAEIHLAILGDRPKYILTVKNHTTNKGFNAELPKKDILSYAEEKNKQGYCVWISLNPKEKDGIPGVIALADFWLDIDRPKKTKNSDAPASKEELDEALQRADQLKEYIESTYNAIGLVAYSGNGYHIHFPLPITEVAPENRESVNFKLRNFAKKVAATIAKEIDSTYDINRKTTLIGSYNLKLPNAPLKTSWDKLITEGGLQSAIKYVSTAREQNVELLTAILAASPGEAGNLTHPTIEGRLCEDAPVRPDLCGILAKDPTLNDVYAGNWEKYKFESRSEAEAYLVINFLRFGLTPGHVREAMKGSRVGKWNDTTKSTQAYRDQTIKKAVAFIKKQVLQANQTPEDQKDRESQADRAVKLFLNEGVELFHDQHGMEYARIPRVFDATDASDANSETKTATPLLSYSIVRLIDTDFRMYLTSLLYDDEQKVMNNESSASATLLLRFKAKQGTQYTLYNRVAPDPSGDGSIWIDLSDYQNRAYHVTKKGWSIENDVPILFKRYQHQKPMVEALKGGDPWKLLQYVNLGKPVKVSDDASNASDASKIRERKKLLLLVQAACYFVPEIPHPINAMFGCPGTRKSTAQKLIRQIFDPSSAPLLSMPRDENAALQNLDHHYIPVFDNLDGIPRWFSDILCRAVTGAGQESRALYTNDDSFIQCFKRCPMINGVNLPAQKGDLLSRTILHQTEPDSDAIRTLEEVEAEYEKDKPGMLGGFLDALVIALKKYSEVRPAKLFRLADFTHWGCALAIALGKTQEDFLLALEENQKSQNTADIEANPVVDAFLEYCKNHLSEYSIDRPKTDKPENIFFSVTSEAARLNINTKTKKWPSAACYFTRRINESKNAIIGEGWNYEIIPKGSRREMNIWPTTPEKKPKPMFSQRVEQPYETGKCQICNAVKALEFEITYDDSSKVLVCFGCGESAAAVIYEESQQ